MAFEKVPTVWYYIFFILLEIEVVILPELLEGNELDTVSECEMLQITDTGKTVVNQVQPGLFWIGAVAVYSPWMNYLGKYGFFFAGAVTLCPPLRRSICMFCLWSFVSRE